MNTIILSRDNLKQFRATFWREMSETGQEWVDALLTHENLEPLDLNTNCYSLKFPCRLLNSTSLREVKVVQPIPSHVKIVVADKNFAPNLTTLSLYNVAFVNQNHESSCVSFEFPVLEKLELRMTIFSNRESKKLESVEIYAPSLTSFTCEPPWFLPPNFPCPPIKIIGPRLNKLSCLNGLPEYIVLDRSLIVSLACLDALDVKGCVNTNGKLPADLLNRFPNLEELMLSHRMAKVLRFGPPLHQNNKLKRLTLLSGNNANQLLKLLHEIPSLKFVSVNVENWEDYDYEAIKTPTCIASHLEEAVLQVFSGEVPQYKLAEFLLKAAKKLKKITITTNDVGPSEEMKKVLSAFDRCSASLEISSRLPNIEHTYTVIHEE